MKVIDMFEYEQSSYRRQLKDLYRTLDNTELPYEVGTEKRKLFLRQMRGRFIQISKLKSDLRFDEALDLLETSNVSFQDIENGIADLKDRDFFLLVTFLGCAHEIPVFLEKIEKAMTPGLRDARSKAKDFLRQYGYRFSDPDDR